MTPCPKENRIELPHFLNWLKTQRCKRCGKVKTEYLDIVYAHQTLGYGFMAGKGHDIWAIAICSECHGSEHFGHKTFWGNTDLYAIIMEQWERYGLEHPKRVFWYPMDFNKMIVGAVTSRWRESLNQPKVRRL